MFKVVFGTPDWIRTSDLQSRSLTLYPTELRAHIHFCGKVILRELWFDDSWGFLCVDWKSWCIKDYRLTGPKKTEPSETDARPN